MKEIWVKEKNSNSLTKYLVEIRKVLPTEKFPAGYAYHAFQKECSNGEITFKVKCDHWLNMEEYVEV